MTSRYLSLLPLLCMASMPAFSADNPLPPVVADGRTQTTVTTSADGHVTVDIAPVATGVTGDISHNSYTNFNVPAAGVSLDNRAIDARTIVNEVSSANPSSIQGTLSVIGNQAHVILSNANGITVNGGKFINTGGVILTTGKISYIDQQVTPITTQRNTIINTTGGQITIEGEGLSGILTNLELIARKIKVDAPITNEHPHENAHVRLIAGQSNIEVNSSISVVDEENDWLRVSPVTLTPAEDPILVDITNLGKITSGRIAIAVTDKGAGVRDAGIINALQKDFTIDTDGNIEFIGGEVSSHTHTIINTTGDILFNGTKVTAGSLSEDGQSIASFGGISLKAANILLSGHESGSDFTRTLLSSTTSTDFTSSDTTHIQGSSVQALGNITAQAGNFLADDVRHNGAWQEANVTSQGGGLVIKTNKGGITNLGSTLQGSSRIVDDVDSTGGVSLISATTIENKTLATDAVATVYSTNDDLSLHAKGRITNNVGQLLSGKRALITSDEDEFHNIAEKSTVDNEGIEQEVITEGSSLFFRSKKIRSWKVSYGEARVPGMAAVLSATDDVIIKAKNTNNYGGNILSHEGKIKITTGTFNTEAMMSGTAWTQRKCRFVCDTKGGSNFAQTGGVVEAQGDIEIAAPGGITNTGGKIQSISGHLLFDTPKPIVTQSLPMYDMMVMNRGIESWIRGSDYAFLMRYDQGGNLRANMGYISVPSGAKIIVDGGTVETADLQIPGGVETIREPVTKPTAITGNHQGFLDGLLR